MGALPCYRVTDPLDSQRRRGLGVPVVEEVPHRQRGMRTVDPHPVSVVLLGGQDHLEVPVGVGVEFVDQCIRGRGDTVHRLQPHIPGCATVTEEPIALTTAHRGAGVQAVRTLHSPCDDVVSARALDAQDRIRIEPQCLVDTGGQQHQQMPHPCREIDQISACGIGFDDLCRLVEPAHQMRPRRGRSTSPRRGRSLAASAIECGNHAMGRCSALTSPPLPPACAGNDPLSENNVFI